MRRWLARAAWAALAAVTAGCGTDPASTTRGLSLEVWLRGEQNLAILYRVETDGTIGFGGGVDGRSRRVTWSGPLTDEEIDRLWALLRANGWFSGNVKAASTGEPRQREYRIRLRWPEGNRRYKIRGANPRVAPVEALLNEASRRRLGTELERLPRPGGRGGDSG
jgi:hypothetical protein